MKNMFKSFCKFWFTFIWLIALLFVIFHQYYHPYLLDLEKQKWLTANRIATLEERCQTYYELLSKPKYFRKRINKHLESIERMGIHKKNSNELSKRILELAERNGIKKITIRLALSDQKENPLVVGLYFEITSDLSELLGLISDIRAKIENCAVLNLEMEKCGFDERKLVVCTQGLVKQLSSSN